jgi:hypothetical protein
MRPQHLLLLVITLFMSACVWVQTTWQRGESVLFDNLGSLGFFIAVVVMALLLWFVRSVVESEPDPFFLNLTFFAIAGQCIKTGEEIGKKSATAGLSLLLVIGLLLLWIEVLVVRAHVRVTINHYKDQLDKAKKPGCPTGEIDRWAKLLVKISGTDLSPGSYNWLTILFQGEEPKERSKEQARDILPDTEFDKESQYLTVTGLTISDSNPVRKRLWLSYMLIPLGSWFVFCWTLFVSR